MKDFKLLERIRSLLRGGKGGSDGSSLFSQKMEQSHYRARLPGGREGSGKKGLLRKWQERKHQQSLQSFGRVAPAKAEKTPRRPLQLLLLTMLLVLLFQLSGPLLSTFRGWQYFRIQEIELSGCRVTTTKDLKEFAGISYEMNMLTIDPEEIEERLLAHPWVAKADLRRVWPDSMVVTIQEHQPQAMIVQGDEDRLYYIADDGVVFAPVESGQEMDFPVITGLDSFDTREEREKMLGDALSFLRLTKRNNPNLPAQSVSEMHFTTAGEMVLYLVEHPFPIYFGAGGVKRKYYQLRKVLEVLYRKQQGSDMISKVAYIRMDYQDNKVLVVHKNAG